MKRCTLLAALLVALPFSGSQTLAAPDSGESSSSAIVINPGQITGDDSNQLEQQREHYQQALKALRNGRQQEFRKLLGQLEHYPLKPYLEHASLKPRLHKLPRREVDAFLSRYQGQRIADRLRQQWLRALKNRRRGEDFVHYYKASLADAKLRCY
ncbi:MAG: hypothetical protein OIF34_03935, partial [Porticoccaceae bacterium]|nr:hypothetical protein [Porticoccaceae bacterium]